MSVGNLQYITVKRIRKKYITFIITAGLSKKGKKTNKHIAHSWSKNTQASTDDGKDIKAVHATTTQTYRRQGKIGHKDHIEST